MTDMTMTRRAALAGSAALAAVPALSVAAMAAPQGETAIGKLWAQAEGLNAQLVAHRAEITRLAADGGISGWMRLGGEANRIGNERYRALVSIFTEAPQTPRDLELMGRAYLDEEIQNGAKSWASEVLANAVVTFHGAKLA
jgi:hypothetical protein